jgi:ABC-2 type transport system permease protein
MRRLFVLARIELLDFFSKYKTGMGIKAGKLGNILVYLTLGILAIPFVQMSFDAYNTFLSIGKPELTITFMYITGILFISLTAVPFLFSSFFYARDLKFLATLPIPEEYIVFSKLSTLYIYLLGINFLVFYPAVVIYVVNWNFKPIAFILGLLVWLLSPLVPLFFSTLVSLALMRVAARSNKKNFLTMFFGLALFILLFGARFMIIEKSGVEIEGLVATLEDYFPPAIWIRRAVSGSLKDILYFILLNFFVIMGLRFTVRKLYKIAILTFDQEGAHRGRIYYKQRNKIIQLLKRNIQIILKQPIFLINTLISLAIPWLILLISIISGDLSLTFFTLPENKYRAVQLILGISSAPALLANLSATSISREGSTFWETRVLPVSTWDNIRSRMMTTVLINFLASFVLGILLISLFQIQFYFFIPGVFFLLTLNLFLAAIDLIINIYRPYLNWSNPTVAIKNNLNVLLSLAFRLVPIMIFFSVFSYSSILGYGNTIFILGLIFLFLYLLTRRYLKVRMVKKFEQIVS